MVPCGVNDLKSSCEFILHPGQTFTDIQSMQYVIHILEKWAVTMRMCPPTYEGCAHQGTGLAAIRPFHTGLFLAFVHGLFLCCYHKFWDCSLNTVTVTLTKG